MNYIRHLNAVLEKFNNDNRLKPLHISLYMALFQHWNFSRFENPVFINRNEMMRASKIGSYNTYHKCMKELTEFAYIRYVSSHSPVEGSKVYLYIFDTTAVQVVIQPSIKSDTTADTTSLLYKHTKLNKGREAIAPTREDVLIFFKSKNSHEKEAAKFFHHYQSNGWVVGRVPMKNWKAAAEKWLLNSQDFKTDEHKSNLNSNNDRNKNYSEPL